MVRPRIPIAFGKIETAVAAKGFSIFGVD